MVERDVLSRVRYLLFVTPTEPLRVHIGLGSLLWGILLLWPGNTFDRPTYALMAHIATEEVWGALHLLHGIAAMWAVLKGSRCRCMFVLDPVLGCALWTSSAIAMMVAVYPMPAAIAPHLVGALSSWWLLVRRVGGDRGF